MPLNAHGAGEELMSALVDALARADQRDGRPSTADERWQAGLILWTGMHGLVSLYNSHGNMPWPPLDHLLAQLLALHTGHAAAEIEPLLGSAGGDA